MMVSGVIMILVGGTLTFYLDNITPIVIGVGFLLVLISFGARRKRESGAKKTEKKPTT